MAPRRIPVPQAPQLTLSGLKHFRGLEGAGMNAWLWFEGKKVGSVLDEGNGGPLYVQCSDAVEDRLEAYVTSLGLPPERWTRDDDPTVVIYERPQTLESVLNAALDAEAHRTRCARLRNTAARRAVSALPVVDDRPRQQHLRYCLQDVSALDLLARFPDVLTPVLLDLLTKEIADSLTSEEEMAHDA